MSNKTNEIHIKNPMYYYQKSLYPNKIKIDEKSLGKKTLTRQKLIV